MLRIIQPTSSKHVVKYPSCESEFEVQAWLFNELKAQGFNVRGEVQQKGAFNRAERQSSCRFDLVVYADDKAIAIIEVKAKPIQHRRGVEATRQGCRYPNFGVPVLFVYGFKDAEDAIEYFRNGMARDGAIPSNRPANLG